MYEKQFKTPDFDWNKVVIKEKALRFTCSGCKRMGGFKQRFVIKYPDGNNGPRIRYRRIAVVCSMECYEYWKLKKC